MTASQAEDIDGFYPFENIPEFEIPLVDQQGNCEDAVNRTDERTESELRAYLSANISEITESDDFRFDVSWTEFDTVEISNAHGCAGTVTNIDYSGGDFSNDYGPKVCTPIVTQAFPDQACDGVVLSSLSSNTHPNGPVTCSDGTYAYCESVAVVDDIQDTGPNYSFNSTLAASRGIAEIRRAFPGALENCSGKGCANVLIDTSQNSRADITVNYQMPISGIFAAILERDSILISHQKLEVIESKVVGRL